MRKNTACLFLFSSLLSISGMAENRKDSTQVGRNYVIDEVVVTGTRNETDIRHLPMTISIVDRQQIEKRYEPSLLPLLTEQVPGVFTTSRGIMGYGVSTGAAGGMSLRGIGGSPTAGLLVLIDGHPQYMGLMGHPIADAYQSMLAERVEVLRGPASVLYGSNAMGGVINIVRKKAVPDFTAGARLSYGNWGVKSTSLDFGGKLAGPLTYRATAHYSTGDGYRHVRADRFSATGSLAANIGKTGYFEGTLGYSDDKYDTEIGSAPTYNRADIFGPDGKVVMAKGSRNPFADYHTIYNDFNNNMMKRRVTDISLSYTQQLASFMKIRDRFSWNHSDLDYAAVEGMSYRTDTVNRFSGGYYYESGSKRYYIDLTDSLKTGSPLCFSPDSRGWTNMLELTGDFKTGIVGHKYILGFTYSYFNYTQYNGWNEGDVWGPGLNQLVSLHNPQLVRNWWDYKYSKASIRDWRTSGLYIHDVIDINNKWKAMGSARMDFYNYRTATAKVKDGRQEYDEADRSEWKKVKTSAFTGRAGLVYIPVEEISLYASFGSHFKPYNTMYSSRVIYLDRNGKRFNPSKDGGEVFKPEKGYQAEIGVRYMWADRIDFSGSVYYIRKNNVVKNLGTQEEKDETTGEMVQKTIQAQVGTADSRGFDLELTVHPVSTLAVTGGLGWQDYRIRKINQSKDYPEYTDPGKNVRATGIPRTTFYVYADYTIPKGLLKNLSFHLSGTFQDKIFTDVANRVYNPALFLVDGGLFYTIKQKVTLALNVDNLFDKEYFKSTTVYGKPRNFTGTISYRF